MFLAPHFFRLPSLTLCSPPNHPLGVRSALRRIAPPTNSPPCLYRSRGVRQRRRPNQCKDARGHHTENRKRPESLALATRPGGGDLVKLMAISRSDVRTGTLLGTFPCLELVGLLFCLPALLVRLLFVSASILSALCTYVCLSNCCGGFWVFLFVCHCLFVCLID